jgi:hypothetical protein
MSNTPDVISDGQITTWADPTVAESVAAHCRNDDPEASYTVVPCGGRWAVECTDDEGLLGYL